MSDAFVTFCGSVAFTLLGVFGMLGSSVPMLREIRLAAATSVEAQLAEMSKKEEADLQAALNSALETWPMLYGKTPEEGEFIRVSMNLNQLYGSGKKLRSYNWRTIVEGRYKTVQRPGKFLSDGSYQEPWKDWVLVLDNGFEVGLGGLNQWTPYTAKSTPSES